MKYFLTGLSGAVLALAIAVPAFGHDLGLSLEERVSDYLIDIGYDQQLIAGEQTLFDFNLYNIRKDGLQEDADYTNVAFEVTLNGTNVFSRKVARNAAKTFMTIVFPTSGQYALHVSFFRGEDKFVETTFSVAVANAVDGKKITTPLDIFEIATYTVGLLVCLGAGIGLLVMRSRRNDGGAGQAL